MNKDGKIYFLDAMAFESGLEPIADYEPDEDLDDLVSQDESEEVAAD